MLTALLLRLLLNPWLGPSIPSLAFFPAILVASWYGGFGAGVLAVVVSTVATHIWFLEPLGVWKIPATYDLRSLILFVVIGIGIAYLSGATKKAEAAERRAAGEWRTTLGSIGDGVIVTDRSSRVRFVNAVAERLTGWTADLAIGRTLEEIFVVATEDGEQRIESPVTRVLRDGRAIGDSNHAVLRHRNGGWLPIANSASPVRNDDGEIEGVVLVFRDQTAERVAERALRRSQGLLQAISDRSPAVIYVKDLEGRYLFVNQSFLDLFHVRAEQMIGRSDLDLFTPEVAETFRAMDRRVADANAALTEEEVVPLEDGEHTYLSVKAPLWDEAGRVYAVFGVSTEITDRKRAEATIRQNEERTRLIIESALDAVVTIDAAGVITGWSAQAVSTFGWEIEEAIGRPLVDTIVPQRYREGHSSGLRRYLDTGETRIMNRRIELAALHRDGREFPVELSITPVQAGGAWSFTAFVRDITERKRMESALVESRQHYQAMAESLPHLVWTCRSDGYCDYLSRQWVEYTGRPADEQLGYGWAEALHPDDRARVESEWAAAVMRGDLYDEEFRLRRHDGVYRWFRTRAVPLRDTAGQPVKWFGSNTDVDDYKRSGQRLSAQLERMDLLDQLTRAIGEHQDLHGVLQVVVRSLEEQLPLEFCCVCLHDRTARQLAVACVGPRSEAMAGELEMGEKAVIAIDSNGLAKCVRGHLVYEPDIVDARAAFTQRLARHGMRSFVAAPLLVESNVFGVLIAARRVANAFSSADCEFLRQLSEHVALAAHQAQLHSALQRAYDDLRQTQQAVMQQERLKALGQMASGIAHDINNAISPVALYTEALLESEPGLSPRARDYLETIQRANEDVAQTVARMREFYRPREAELVLSPVNLNDVARDVISLTRARWSDMPQQLGYVIELDTSLSSTTPLVLGVESELREALTNLVFNAVDAMPEGGTLSIRTRRTEDPTRATNADRVYIEVSDTGVGMDADTRRRCLEPFFTTKGERGTGLGLATVYGTVQRHGAEIFIVSAPGMGTTVQLIFDGASASTPARKDQGPAVRIPRLRILVIDDDPLLLKSLRDTLENDGHLVTPAGGGHAGLEAFSAAREAGTPFNVVITDLGMPYVDGRQVAAGVKQLSPSTPVLLLTGWGQRLVDDGEIPPHVDKVLNKPPKLSDLRPALAEFALVAKGA